jgi:type III secretion system low calcium response chaperone LcrH/SycD
MKQQMSFAEEVAMFADMPLAESLSSQEQEELYALAYTLYNQGNYPHAGQFFKRLVLCNPFAENYWRGLASSQQMQKEYLNAVHAWATLALLVDQDPLPHFHAAECLFSLEEKEEALRALEAAESLLAPADAHQELRKKIALLKQVYCHVT